MNYVINVSFLGEHLFRTAEDSVGFYALPKVVEVMRKKFPKGDGYEVTITRWTKTGTTLEDHEIFQIPVGQ